VSLSSLSSLSIGLVLGSSTGGVGAHVRDLAAGLVARGHQVTVAAPEQTGEQFGFARLGARFNPVRIPNSVNPLRDLGTVRALRAALAGTGVVHAHGVRAGALTGLALARHGQDTPIVVTLHNAMLASGPKLRLLTRLEQLAVRRAAVVLGASADLVEHARGLGAREARLGPVPAPPLPAPVRDRAQVRAELGLDGAADGASGGDRVLVLAIGRLAPQKDYPTMLRAARLWQQARQPAEPDRDARAGAGTAKAPRLVIAGDGPLRGALQTEIDTLGLDALLLGRRADVADLLAAADILVLSSAWEARALTVQEAMRAGVPVVAASTGGTPDLVGDAAVLVPAGDAGALADAVLRLAEHPGERERLAALGRERAGRWPDTGQVLSELEALYSSLAARPMKR
jgi:glycosyltransferase involved in cell wall biosynthesis